MKYYKILNKDLKDFGFQYVIGKEYNAKEQNFENGFLVEKTLFDCVCHISDSEKIVVEVSATKKKEKGSFTCLPSMKLERIVPLKEIMSQTNIGMGNSGYLNVGIFNKGHYNTGSCNYGRYNSGSNNDGSYNAGEKNNGSSNTGDENNGARNTGNGNTGDRNTGHFNKGNYNVGNFNIGDKNIGSKNVGNKNMGDSNYGSHNFGNCNHGNYNIGDYNIGNGIYGCLSTISSNEFLVFNKPYKKEEWEKVQKPFLLDSLNNLHDEHYKHMWASGFEFIQGEDRLLEIKALKALPNWDAKVFKEITGITIK